MAAPEPVQTINVVLTSPNGIKADAELRITEWTDNKRAAIAYKRLGMWWVAALFLIIIPPHILWFSIAFIGGIVAAILAMRQQALVHPQEVVCPDCHTPAKINEQPAVWPLGARCGECRLVLWVEPRKG